MEFTEITSRQNATLKHLARLAREKKYRLATGEMVCEGDKMLYEALSSGTQIKSVLVRSGAMPDSLAQDYCIRRRSRAQRCSVQRKNSLRWQVMWKRHSGFYSPACAQCRIR